MEEAGGPPFRQQRFDFPSENLIGRASFLQKSIALVTSQLQRAVVQIFDLLPSFRSQSIFDLVMFAEFVRPDCTTLVPKQTCSPRSRVPKSARRFLIGHRQ